MARTNIKYLKENNLYEAHKQFLRMVNESYGSIPDEELDEAGEEEMPQDPMAGGAPGGDPMGGGAPGGDPMGGGDAQNPSDLDNTPVDGGARGGEGGPDPTLGSGMGEDPIAGGGDMPSPELGGDMPPTAPDAEPEGDDDSDEDTIDIDGLTKAQEKLNDKQNMVGQDLAKVDDRIEKLMGALDKMTSMIDNNNQEIERLKGEIEKRNPTQTEKLNMRSLDSYPFNIKPTDYWAAKEKEGGYQAYADNDEPTTKEYVITNDDVDNPDADIADTFSRLMMN